VIVIAGIVVALLGLGRYLRRRKSTSSSAQPTDEDSNSAQPTDQDRRLLPKAIRLEEAAGGRARRGRDPAGRMPARLAVSSSVYHTPHCITGHTTATNSTPPAMTSERLLGSRWASTAPILDEILLAYAQTSTA